MTKVRNLKVRFDQHTLNTYLGFEDVEPKEYLEKYALEDAARPWLAKIIVAPGPPPPWIGDWGSYLPEHSEFRGEGVENFCLQQTVPELE